MLLERPIGCWEGINVAKSFAQIRQERKAGLRAVRAAQQNLDSNIERLERLLFRLLRRKMVLTTDDAKRIADAYNKLPRNMNDLAKFIADFFILVADYY